LDSFLFYSKVKLLDFIHHKNRIEYKYNTLYNYSYNYSYMLTFRELLEDKSYHWALYFYHLESKPDRTTLENALLKSYHSLTNGMIDRCCCDETPVRNCPPECCTREECKTCKCTLRICRDVWFSAYHGILCFDCFRKEREDYD